MYILATSRTKVASALLAALSVLTFWSNPIAASEQGGTAGASAVGTDAERAKVIDRRLSGIAAPGLDSEMPGSTSSLNLEAAQGKESVSIVLTKSLQGQSPNRRQSLFKLSLKGPIGSGATEADLLDLDGLSNFVTAGFSLTHNWWPFPSDEKTRMEIIGKQVELCREYAEANGSTFDPMQESCNEGYFKLDQRRGGELRDRFELVTWGNRPIYFFGGEASYGQAVFEFVDPGSLEEAVTTEYGNSISLYAGLLKFRPSKQGRSRSDTLVFAGYRREETYSAGAKTDLCTPLGDADALRCDSVTLGAPTEKIRDLAFVELRRFFPGPVGVSPRLTYDFEDDVTGVELPVYLVTDAAGGLTGGLRGSWRSDTEEIKLAVFVGKKFDFSTP